MPADRRVVAGIAGGLAAAAVFAGALAMGWARAWLAAAFLCAAVPGGAALLAMMTRLIPGRWRDGLGPSLAVLLGTWPAGALAVAPVLFAPGLVYPWPGRGAGGGAFRAVWLSQPFFQARGIAWLALVGWIALRVRAGRLSAPEATVGLLAYVLLTSLVGVDWLGSLDPDFASSGFGLYAIAIMGELACGLAVALAVARGIDERARDVLGGVLLTAAILWAYLGFMQFFIVWSGDLPPGARWYLARKPWAALAWITAALKLGAPLALMVGHVRRNPRALAGVALASVVGAAPELAWLTLPGGPAALALSVVGVAALALAAAGAAARLPPSPEAPA